MDIRERLLDGARRVFEEAGSRGATTRRIAQEAGVNEVTLFRHFGSKAVLLHEALHSAFQRSLVSRLPEEPVDPEGELVEWCRTHLQGMYRARALIRTCMGEMEQEPELAACAGSTPAQVADELRAYLLRLRERGMADGGFDPSAAAAMLMGTLFTDAMGRDIMPERYAYSMEEAPARYVALFLRAIGARAPGGSVPEPADDVGHR